MANSSLVPESQSALNDPAREKAEVGTTRTTELLLPYGTRLGRSEDDETTSSSTGNTLSSQQNHTMMGSVANLCSATLGAGVLSLPFALYDAGILCGLVLLAISAWATVYSIQILVVASHVHNERTYEDLVETVLGKKMRIVVEANIVIFCIGATVAYLTVVGDIMEQTICDHESRQKFMIIVWTVAMVPLSMCKTYSALQFASSVSIVSISTLLVCAFWHLLYQHNDVETGDVASLGLAFGQFDQNLLYPSNGIVSILQACPIIIFAYSCQVNVSQVFDELPRELESSEKLGRMQSIAWVATGICSLLYVCISLIGLFDFGSLVTPNILSSYDPESVMQLAFMSMALAVTMAFPLSVLPSRVTFMGVLDQWRSKDRISSVVTNEADEETQETTDSLTEPLLELSTDDIDVVDSSENAAGTLVVWREQLIEDFEHISITLALCVIGLFFALVAPNVSIVFGLMGGTTASVTGFVIPGMLGLKTVHGFWDKTVCYILVVGGSVVGIVTTIVTAFG